MAFYNFGNAANAIQAATQANQGRNTSPPGIDLANFNTGDVLRSQISSVQILGGRFDFLWGNHLWGNTKYKVVK